MLADLGVDPASDEAPRWSTRSLVLGGLRGRGLRQQLHRHLDALVRFSDLAIGAGARAPRGQRARTGAPAWEVAARRLPRRVAG